MKGWTVGREEFTRQAGPLSLRVYAAGGAWAWEVQMSGRPQHGDIVESAGEGRAVALECALGWAQEAGDEDLVRELADDLPPRARAVGSGGRIVGVRGEGKR